MQSGVGGRIDFVYDKETDKVKVDYFGLPKNLVPDTYYDTGTWRSSEISVKSAKKMIEGLLGISNTSTWKKCTGPLGWVSWRCSNCNAPVECRSDYCPECGREMERE